MHTEYVLRTLRHGGDIVDIEIGRVGGKHRALLGELIDLAEHFLFDRHRLEHSLNDEVRILDVLDADHTLDEAHALGRSVSGNTAACCSGIVVLLHDAEAALELFVASLDQRDGNSCVGKRHRDATTHGACANDRNALHVTALGAVGNARDFRRFTLGEECIALRLGLFAVHQLGEQLALGLDRLVERLVERMTDGFGGGKRSFKPAILLIRRSSRIGENGFVGFGGGELGIVVAQFAQRLLVGDHFFGEGFSACDLGIDNLVDRASLQCFGCADEVATDNHLDGEFRTNGARQSLRAACTGQQTELHFRQPDLRFLGGDAVMTTKREFKTATERRSVNGCDDRFRAILDDVNDIMQTWRLRRLAKLSDVGAGNEGAARACNDDGLHGRIRDRGIHTIHNALPHRSTQRVDRWAVDCDDGDCVMTFHLDHLAHANSP